MNFTTLISAEELAKHIDDPRWRIFDCRHDLARPDFGEQAYFESHVPNAQFLHLDRDLSGPKTGTNGRHPLPDPARFAQKLGECGVSNEMQVIAYDDDGSMYAVRLWWLMRWLGHSSVAILDGGLPAWQRADLPLTDKVPQFSQATFKWQISDQPVDTSYIEAHLNRHDMLLLDGRGADRFRGENEVIDPVAGHIPGAVNRPFRDNLLSDGRFKPATQLHQELAGLLNGKPVSQVVAYCGSGVSACHNLLALEVAGLHGARLYAGSWSEWCSDRNRPVATGNTLSARTKT